MLFILQVSILSEQIIILDSDITIYENRFVNKIYHKVDDFDFELVTFPFPKSNILDNITYNSFYSQLVRFSLVCSKFNDFDIPNRNLLESIAVSLIYVSVVGRLLGETWKYDGACLWWGRVDGSFSVGKEMC